MVGFQSKTESFSKDAGVGNVCFLFVVVCDIHEFLCLQNLCFLFMGNLVFWPSRGVLCTHMEFITHDL